MRGLLRGSGDRTPTREPVLAPTEAVSRTQEPSGLVSTLLYVVDEGSGLLTGQTLNVAGGSAYL
ncbi:hypothetical protein [Streptomyces sp. NBC_00996]|uniref:hypothetical protein n=1 Tax=Streptomyces sp. NBC_00996 TaxID=2903710 RepID=UPI00386FE93D|nr:hypothetical protein OG390_44450 [Streptomyces sp. NBC_00996]